MTKNTMPTLKLSRSGNAPNTNYRWNVVEGIHLDCNTRKEVRFGNNHGNGILFIEADEKGNLRAGILYKQFFWINFSGWKHELQKAVKQNLGMELDAHGL